MTYVNSAYQNQTPYLSNQIAQLNPAQQNQQVNNSFFPTAQSISNISASGLQNIAQGQTSQIQQPLFIQTGGGKGGKKGQSNISVLGGYNIGGGNNPLILQTSGGKGGKKGQSSIVFGGGYSVQGAGNNFANGPLFIQTGGGKGGKKGQTSIALLSGYGVQQPGSQNITNNHFFNQPQQGVQHGGWQPQQASQSPVWQFGGQFGSNEPTQSQPQSNTQGGEYLNPQIVNNFNNNPFPVNNTNQNNNGGFSIPLILQTAGGKGGKKGQSNIIIGGGYGFGNQGFNDFNGPLFLNAGGGKGGKKGVSNISFIGGYGLNNTPAQTTTNNFFHNTSGGFGQHQYGYNNIGNHFGFQNSGHNHNSYSNNGYYKSH